MENLENIIESVLFVSGKPLPISDFCYHFEVTEKEVQKAIEKLQEKYDGKSGIQINTFGKQLQLQSNPNYVEQIAQVLQPIRERNLTKAALETVAIIAYKQPITRTEIEQTRNNHNSDYALNILLEHNLVEIVGRKDTVGKPALFGTTNEFLRRFGLNDIKDLPDYDELMSSIQKMRESYSESLFNFDSVTTDENAEKKQEVEFDKRLEDVAKDDSIIVDDGYNDDIL